MDKKTREKMAQIIIDGVTACERAIGLGLTENAPFLLADQILSILKELGYQKVPELKVLNDRFGYDKDGNYTHWGGDSELSGLESVAYYEGKQAQLDYDRRQIEEANK